MSTQKTRVAGHMAAIFTMLIWGTTFISTKVLLESLSPLEILVLRFVAGYIFLWLIRPVPLKLKSVKEELIMVVAGITGIGIYYLLENIALTMTQASNVSVIVSVAPIFTGIMAHFFLDGERMKKSIVAGFICAMVGICLITFQKGEKLELNPLGDFLGLAAAAIWGIRSTSTMSKWLTEAFAFCSTTMPCPTPTRPCGTRCRISRPATCFCWRCWSSHGWAGRPTAPCGSLPPRPPVCTARWMPSLRSSPSALTQTARVCESFPPRCMPCRRWAES